MGRRAELHRMTENWYCTYVAGDGHYRLLKNRCLEPSTIVP